MGNKERADSFTKVAIERIRNMPNAPLTLCVLRETNRGHLTLGLDPNLHEIETTGQASGSFWFVVLDRHSLEIVVNVLAEDDGTVPEVVLQNNDDGHILVFASLGVSIDRAPKGNLLRFLQASGAGEDLDRLVQIAGQLSNRLFSRMSYGLVGVMGTGSTITPAFPGLERGTLSQVETISVMTAQLVPTLIMGRQVYSPEEVGH